jgi:hypothetical protein
MPEPLWIYLMALLYFPRVSTCVTIAEAFAHTTHDRLTRMLNGRWSGQTLLDMALRTLFAVAGGYRILDDTVVAKPSARWLGEAAWVWSTKDKQGIFGVSVVLLVWTDGQVRIPVSYRVWHQGGPSKYALALALLSEARNRLQCKPQWVLCDAWDPSKALRKRLRDSGWSFVCQLKKPRRFDGQPLPRSLQQPYGQAVGFLAGDMKVLVGKYRRKDSATNQRSLTAKEVRQHDNIRHAVEEGIRTGKSQRGLAACQAGYRRRGTETTRPQPRVQEHHVALCLVAYLIVERERLDRQLTWRQCKRQLILKGMQHSLRALERVRKAA